MSSYDKASHHVPDKITLTGNAAKINQDTNLLIQKALQGGSKYDLQIFAEFEGILAKYSEGQLTLRKQRPR